jgi:hypothetical protein
MEIRGGGKKGPCPGSVPLAGRKGISFFATTHHDARRRALDSVLAALIVPVSLLICRAKLVQQTGVAMSVGVAGRQTRPSDRGFKNQPLSVQQIATPEVRNRAFYGRFERFEQTAIVAFIHAALERVWGVVAQVRKRIRKPLLYPFELWGHLPNPSFQPLK